MDSSDDDDPALEADFAAWAELLLDIYLVRLKEERKQQEDSPTEKPQ